MKPFLVLMLFAALLVGCGGRITRLERMSRVESAVLTDANALSQETSGNARPTVEISDPDRLVALEKFLKERRKDWQKVEGRPRPARFQLELLGQGRPIYTVWIDRGYLALAEGKEIQEMRLSNNDSAELLACLGLPPDYLAPPPATVSDPSSGVVPADWVSPKGMPTSASGPPHAP